MRRASPMPLLSAVVIALWGCVLGLGLVAHGQESQIRTLRGQVPTQARPTFLLRAASGQLVYVCQQLPCQDGQEVAVFDPGGAPIFTVPETGGPKAFGDCGLSDFPPGSVSSVAAVVCFESPALYAQAHPGYPVACVTPAVWLAPRALWVCSAGVWVQKVSLSP